MTRQWSVDWRAFEEQIRRRVLDDKIAQSDPGQVTAFGASGATNAHPPALPGAFGRRKLMGFHKMLANAQGAVAARINLEPGFYFRAVGKSNRGIHHRGAALETERKNLPRAGI